MGFEGGGWVGEPTNDGHMPSGSAGKSAPFDVQSVKLKPGQVIKAWIDPDFLKGLE